MRTEDFRYELPEDLIAQRPTARRDASRLLVLHRVNNVIEHRSFKDLPEFLREGDVLVLNNSRVIRARLRGVNLKSSGRFEILLLQENARNDWWAMMKPGKRARVGSQIEIQPQPAPDSIGASANRQQLPRAIVMETNAEGHRRLQFEGTQDIFEDLSALGAVPLPPYIQREASGEAGTEDKGLPSDVERYQTVYATENGSVAAPTAGLHFTEGMLDHLRARGVHVCFVTLHVGVGTFAPVKTESIEAHRMHEERFEAGDDVVRAVNQAKAEHRRVIAVGTTCVRVLEHLAALNDGKLVAGSGRTAIFIHPPCAFRIVDALLTNFHLPCSTLLMLASAFASPGETRGRTTLLAAYAEAIRHRYRFFSYGDAMLIL